MLLVFFSAWAQLIALFLFLEITFYGDTIEKMMRVLFFFGLLSLCVCEKVPINWAPYPASSIYTGEYGAPPLPASSIQISRENVQFAGRQVEINPSNSRHASKHFEQLRKPPVVSFELQTILHVVFPIRNRLIVALSANLV